MGNTSVYSWMPGCKVERFEILARCYLFVMHGSCEILTKLNNNWFCNSRSTFFAQSLRSSNISTRSLQDPAKKSFNGICDALRDMVPFIPFKKGEKHPRRSVNFSKVAGFKPATLLKLTLLHGCFSPFLN